MRAPHHIVHTPRETLASTPRCLFLGRQRSHGCRLHRPGPRTPQETVHPRTASSQAVSSLPQEQQDLPHPSGLHLLSLSFLVLLLLPRSWERQAPLSSLHLCSDLSSGSMLIHTLCTHTHMYTHMYTHTYVHTQHSQPQPLFPYGIFHLSAKLINFISCLLDGKSRAGASFPVNRKQQ